MIYIDENYRILSKDLNLVIECNQEVKEHFNTNPDKVGTKRWQTIGYFTTFGASVKFLRKEEGVNEDALRKIEEIQTKIEAGLEEYKKIQVDKSKNSKIIVNDKWYIVGTDMIYRMIKKEQIQSSRFTKEENVGKDKFISMGFVPDVVVGLKTILNETILEHLTEKNNSTLEDLMALVDTYIENVKNIYTEDVVLGSEDTIEELDDNVPHQEEIEE